MLNPRVGGKGLIAVNIIQDKKYKCLHKNFVWGWEFDIH